MILFLTMKQEGGRRWLYVIQKLFSSDLHWCQKLPIQSKEIRKEIPCMNIMYFHPKYAIYPKDRLCSCSLRQANGIDVTLRERRGVKSYWLFRNRLTCYLFLWDIFDVNRFMWVTALFILDVILFKYNCLSLQHFVKNQKTSLQFMFIVILIISWVILNAAHALLLI